MTVYQRLSLLLLPLACGLVGAEEPPLLLQAAQMKALGIETVVAGQYDTARPGSLPGHILVPNAQMRVLAAPVSGMIEMLAVAPGASVKKGQVLAHLSSPQALELQRNALQTNSQAKLLQQSLKRDEVLFAEGIIAESRLQATRAAAQQANALASESRQGLTLSGATPGKLGGFLALTAAIDGVVLEQGAQLGQRVEAATLIYRIAQLTPLWVEIQAPVALAAKLKEGDVVKIARSEVSGKLISVGRAVDPASQTVLLRAEVNQGAESLRPGQVVEVEVTETNPSGQSLPASALVRYSGKTLAFVQTTGSDSSIGFIARPVKVISQSGENVTVEGINEGERVVSKGGSGLKAMLAGVGKE